MTLSIVFVGRREPKHGDPFAGQGGRVLDECLVEAGLQRSDVATFDASDVAATHSALARLKPRVVVTLGAEASHAVIPEWPDSHDGEGGLWHRGVIRSARDIENRRGYIFDSRWGPVVATIHPGFAAKTWVPWRMLLSYDLQRAKEISRDGLVRPTRDVEIVGSDRDARRALESLGRFRLLSCDIETRGDTSLACIGFAGESGKAHVFPAQYLSRAAELLGDPGRSLIFANGIYDLFVLKHRCSVKIRARIEDAQIAWHAAYAELAGAKENKKKRRFTRKSLAFLASLFTKDAWWKGDYETEEEFFVYNGKDCCITLDVWHGVMREVAKMGAEATYEHERGLMWPCVDMLARGLRVDEGLRLDRLRRLEAEIGVVTESANRIVVPLIERERERLVAMEAMHLFEETDGVCPCCRHAAKKQARCWSCAGFEEAPSKASLIEKFGGGGSKAVLEETHLGTCRVCGGRPRETRIVANLNSETQLKTLLFDVLGAPKRFQRNTKGESVLTVNEGALKSILGALPE